MEILLEFETHGSMDSAISPISDNDLMGGDGGDDNDGDDDGGDEGDRSKPSFQKSQTGRVPASKGVKARRRRVIRAPYLPPTHTGPGEIPGKSAEGAGALSTLNWEVTPTDIFHFTPGGTNVIHRHFPHFGKFLYKKLSLDFRKGWRVECGGALSVQRNSHL